jgi:hypothetical protein
MEDPLLGNKKVRPARVNLRVTIFGAKGLRAADFSLLGKGKSDPFARVQIQGRPHSKFETPHIKKTLEPEWNATHIFEGVKAGDSLEFEVFDYDMMSSPDLLGKIVVPYESFGGPEGLEDELTLEETEGAASTIYIKIEHLPKDTENEPDTRCYVNILSATDLRSADWGGKSDPYCTCEVVGKPHSKIQTKVLFRTLDPVWNEEDEVVSYDEADDLRFEVWDYDLIGKPDSLGYVIVNNDDFHPQGYSGKLYLESGGKGHASITVEIEIDMPPPPPEPIDPLEHITHAEIQRVPFQLRSLETNRVHPLRAHTSIGRSKKLLDPEKDLIIDSAVSGDVGRVHGHIKACLLPDYATWLLRVYDPRGGGGLGNSDNGRSGGHAGQGTSVDGEPVDKDIGYPIQPGSVIRFGKNELWTLECSALYSKSERAAAAQGRALVLEEDDPAAMRELHIPTIACHDAIQSCKDWISVVRVTLEWLNEPDEPPCVDYIEVTDELRRTASVHSVSVFEEQQAYDVRQILRDVRLGTTLKLRLCSDPFLLAPVLTYLEELNQWLADQYENHNYD